jgi:formate dehydrogenase subunit delta
MDISRLVAMANDIAAFFDAEPGQPAAEGVRNHIARFWAPRMRREIIAHWKNGGAGLVPTASAAIEKLSLGERRLAG